MSGIKNFLKIKPKLKETKIVPVNIGGVDVEFEVQSIKVSDINNIQLENTVTFQPSFAGGPTSSGVDNLGFVVDILDQAVIEPDLDDVDIQNNFNAYSRQEVLTELFNIDSEAMGKVATAVVELSNKNKDDKTSKERVEEAKN